MRGDMDMDMIGDDGSWRKVCGVGMHTYDTSPLDDLTCLVLLSRLLIEGRRPLDRGPSRSFLVRGLPGRRLLGKREAFSSSRHYNGR